MDRRALMHRARELRRNATEPERVLWELLRDRRCLGLKFRRQMPYRGFVLDFFCRELALDLELDGSIHDAPAARTRDTERDQMLRACGLRVVRVRNTDIAQKQIEEILAGVPPLRVCGEGDRG